jgi:hypothetical protein
VHITSEASDYYGLADAEAYQKWRGNEYRLIKIYSLVAGILRAGT